TCTSVFFELSDKGNFYLGVPFAPQGRHSVDPHVRVRPEHTTVRAVASGCHLAPLSNGQEGHGVHSRSNHHSDHGTRRARAPPGAGGGRFRRRTPGGPEDPGSARPLSRTSASSRQADLSTALAPHRPSLRRPWRTTGGPAANRTGRAGQRDPWICPRARKGLHLVSPAHVHGGDQAALS